MISISTALRNTVSTNQEASERKSPANFVRMSSRRQKLSVLFTLPDEGIASSCSQLKHTPCTLFHRAKGLQLMVMGAARLTILVY